MSFEEYRGRDMEYLMHEIFEKFEKAETRKEKIQILKKFGNSKFKTFLNYALNPNIKFDVEIPVYKPSLDPAGLNTTYIDNEIDRTYRFIVGHPKRAATLTALKQKQLLTILLESLHAGEADFYVRMLKKDLKVKFLTRKLVKEVFPELPFEA